MVEASCARHDVVTFLVEEVQGDMNKTTLER